MSERPPRLEAPQTKAELTDAIKTQLAITPGYPEHPIDDSGEAKEAIDKVREVIGLPPGTPLVAVAQAEFNTRTFPATGDFLAGFSDEHGFPDWLTAELVRLGSEDKGEVDLNRMLALGLANRMRYAGGNEISPDQDTLTSAVDEIAGTSGEFAQDIHKRLPYFYGETDEMLAEVAHDGALGNLDGLMMALGNYDDLLSADAFLAMDSSPVSMATEERDALRSAFDAKAEGYVSGLLTCISTAIAQDKMSAVNPNTLARLQYAATMPEAPKWFVEVMNGFNEAA